MKNILLVVFCALLCGAVEAQRIITGRVTDDQGEGIPGVNVIPKGTSSGTSTDLDGNYRLEIGDEVEVLVYSFVGLETQEIQIGSRTVIDVQMRTDVQKLSEVVVTAIGIEKESRKLGYGVSTVGSEELLVAREPNLASSLQGKVTGVQIVPQSGNLGGSVAVRIRGVTSLSGGNTPLWVVDGIPISDGFASAGGGISGGIDSYNTAGILNPDDIASVNVLKGASATALYGSRASAGVIVVTTKRGSGNQGRTRVTVNSSVRVDNIFKIPDYQNSYSAGDLAKYDSSATFNNWGARIVGQEVTQAITGERGPLEAFEDNYDDFFDTGLTLINNVAVSSGTNDFDYRLSLTNLVQTGILPGARLDRTTASFNAGKKHNEKLETRFGITFVRSETQGGGAQGANDPNVLGLTQFVRTVDFREYRPWIDESGNQINMINPQSNNPFWIMRENQFLREDDRVFGNVQLTYKPITKLALTGRMGVDFNTDESFRSNRIGTIGAAQGDFTNTIRQRRQLDFNGYATWTDEINDDISYRILGGFNFNRRVFESDGNFGDRLAVVNLFDPGNVASNTPNRDFTDRILMGTYGEIEVTYKNWLTINATGRNDWSSTLPLDNNSYFYPSISAGFVFTDAFGISNNVLSYGKLRASAAQVGGDTNPFLLNFTFDPVANVFGQFGTNITFPFNGAFAFDKTNQVPPTSLVPEEQNNIEFGAEFQLFDGRVGLDVAYFRTRTNNQILGVPIPESTGFTTRLINAGETQTQGVEISLNADVIKAGDFNWKTTFNFTSTQFEVLELVEGIERLNIGEGFNSVQVVAEEGTSFELRTSDYLRDSISGRPVIDPETGLRIPGQEANFGDIFPDFTLGWVNNLSWRGINLRFTFDYREGGVFRSGTISGLRDAGAVVETVQNREGTFIDRAGVIDNGDGTFRDNDIPVRSARDFWTTLNNNNVSADAVFEATFVKLREIGLSYTFPRKLIENSPFENISIGFEGRNLALIYTKVPHVDPEAGSLLGAGSDAFGIERNSVPTTRSLGFNVKLGF